MKCKCGSWHRGKADQERAHQLKKEGRGQRRRMNGRPASVRKIAAAVAVLVMCAATPARAWEFKRNPDRFPSIGVLIQNYKTGGDQTDVTGPNPTLLLVENGRSHEDSIDLGVDVRLPASDSLTVSMSYTSIDGERVLDRSGGTYRSTSNLNGYRASLGFRLYFNK